MVCRAWAERVDPEQIRKLQELPNFIHGYVYPSVVVLDFSVVIDDELLRSILHPTMFVVTTARRNMMKTNIITPTDQQRAGFNALFRYWRGEDTPQGPSTLIPPIIRVTPVLPPCITPIF